MGKRELRRCTRGRDPRASYRRPLRGRASAGSPTRNVEEDLPTSVLIDRLKSGGRVFDVGPPLAQRVSAPGELRFVDAAVAAVDALKHHVQLEVVAEVAE